MITYSYIVKTIYLTKHIACPFSPVIAPFVSLHRLAYSRVSTENFAITMPKEFTPADCSFKDLKLELSRERLAPERIDDFCEWLLTEQYDLPGHARFYWFKEADARILLKGYEEDRILEGRVRLEI
jgi:hypothetical protein